MKTLFLLLLLVSFSTFAQQKHPRVAELEDKYKQDASSYLQGRFPGLPLSVTVSIDPLRRSYQASYNLKGETLPYYAIEEEEIRDEWDDPTAALYSLVSRVKKIHVKVQLPSNVKNEEVVEIKETLAKLLRLVPARDEVEIIKRKWTVLPHLQTYALLAGSILLVLLLGLLLISKLSARQLAKSVEKLQVQTSNQGGGGGAGNIKVTTQEHKGAKKKSSDNIRFDDPIKTRDVIGQRVSLLIEKGEFLRLENMIKLDELGLEDPEALGALLSLFPMDIQKKIFSLSHGSHWMEAFTKPGQLTFDCLQIVEDMGRLKSMSFNESWELLTIQVWRLGELAPIFLKSIKQEHAFAILNGLPKFISVPLAREVFPGNWASLLDPSYQTQPLESQLCDELYQQAVAKKALVPFEILETYKKERELLKFLHMADFQAEKEVYEVLPDDSLIRSIRPPFYEIFDGSQELIEKLVRMVSVDDWSLALFNVPRDKRKVVEELLTSKEKYFYFENLKSYDNVRPEMEEIGDMREKIAKLAVEARQEFVLDVFEKVAPPGSALDREFGDAA